MRPRVHTEKHIVQVSLATVASGAISARTIAFGVVTPTATNTDVREGSIISAVYIEMWLTSDDAGSSTAIVTLERRSGNMVAMLVGQSAALNSYVNKKNILHTFMGLVPTNVQYPMPAIKGWFKIPKGKQRFGINDLLVLNIHGQSNGLTLCGFFVYKEQY